MRKNDKIKINGIESGANYVEVLDDITSDIDKALSVNQGKIIKEKVALIEQNVLDNNTNIENIKGDVDKLKSAPTLLFSGAVKNIDSKITLTEGIYMFKYLIIGISIDSTGSIYYLNPCMNIEGNTNFRPNLVAPIGTASVYNTMRTYSGLLKKDSETQLSISYPFKYLSHIADTNHSEISDTMYVREIWGVR